MRKSAACALEHRDEFFCTASWMQRRLTRNALAAKGRTGPTAGETGPRCGRTCGATRQQRNDDSLRISNHALKKGGPSAKCSAFASATGPDLHWANGLGKSVFKSWRNLRGRAMGARNDQAVGRWRPCGLLCRLFPARRAIERLPRHHRAAARAPPRASHTPCRCGPFWSTPAIKNSGSDRSSLRAPDALPPPAGQAHARSHCGSPWRWEENVD
jgi:hypothetical protein